MDNLTVDKIFRSEYNNISNYIRMRINNNSDVDDITSEVFFKVSKCIDTYDNTKKLSTWLLTIANNAIIDHYRKNKYNCNYIKVSEFVNEDGKEMFQFSSLKNLNADYNINNNDIARRIDKAIDKLPQLNLKQIAKMFFIDQLNYIEIAEILQIPLGSVKGFIFKVRELLQIELKDLYNVRSKINVEIL